MLILRFVWLAIGLPAFNALSRSRQPTWRLSVANLVGLARQE